MVDDRVAPRSEDYGTAVWSSQAPLYPILSDRVASVVLSPLAVHETRNWILLPDGGPVLGAVLEGRGLIDGLCAAVPHFAQLQLATYPLDASRLAPRADLVEQLERSCHLGKVARSLSWVAALAGLGTADAEDYAD